MHTLYYIHTVDAYMTAAFTNDFHICFSVNVHVCILLYYTVDTYLTAVYINVYKIIFNVYITAFACFDGYARIVTLITHKSYSDY